MALNKCRSPQIPSLKELNKYLSKHNFVPTLSKIRNTVKYSSSIKVIKAFKVMQIVQFSLAQLKKRYL